jgi:hypothetical protein
MFAWSSARVIRLSPGHCPARGWSPPGTMHEQQAHRARAPQPPLGARRAQAHSTARRLSCTRQELAAWSPPGARSQLSLDLSLPMPYLTTNPQPKSPTTRCEARRWRSPTSVLIHRLYGLCRSPSLVAAKKGLVVSVTRVCYRSESPEGGRSEAEKWCFNRIQDECLKAREP